MEEEEQNGGVGFAFDEKEEEEEEMGRDTEEEACFERKERDIEQGKSKKTSR